MELKEKLSNSAIEREVGPCTWEYRRHFRAPGANLHHEGDSFPGV